jgi:uncharacterized integral membrane protein
MGRVWSEVILFALVLLVLLIFILQNGQRVKVSFLGFHGHLPLAVAMLLAAVAGALLAAIPGVGRMIQLRRVARRHRYADARTGPQAPVPGGSRQVSAGPGQVPAGSLRAPGGPGQVPAGAPQVATGPSRVAAGSGPIPQAGPAVPVPPTAPAPAGPRLTMRRLRGNANHDAPPR